MATDVHPTVIIDPATQLGTGVKIGPYSVIGPNVKLGDDCVIHNHVTLMGNTTLGPKCEVFPGAVVGGPPQDLKYRGSLTRLEIGEQTVIREYCTLNPGTELGGGITSVGQRCLLMAYCHIAHDCIIENNVIIANCAQLAGHVHVQEGARISGLCAIHHFVRVGRGSMVAGMARLSIDVPPYTMAEGHPAKIIGLNIEGLRRRKETKEASLALKQAYRYLFREQESRLKAYELIVSEQLDKHTIVSEFVEFVKKTDQGRHGRALEAVRAEVPPEERDGILAVKTDK